MGGEMIGSYRVVRELGQGGMGTVLHAVDTMLEREVALKVLRADLAGEPELAERFRTEAIILARLNHPNIATLYGLVREGAHLFMVMELVRGATLDRRLRQDGRVPPDLAARWACQILDAMAYAHRQGVVHRDIKPANIMVTEEDTIKVMDFGIARVLGSAHQTRHGHVIGTASYMAPEQIRGQDVDGRTDIYALGVVLYQLVAGVTPFRGSDEFAVMTAQINEPPRPPSAHAGQLPAWLEDAILRALQKDPAARFQDATAFRRVLEEGLRGPDSAGTPAASVRAGAKAGLPGDDCQATLLTPTSSPGLPAKVAGQGGSPRRTGLYAGIAVGLVLLAAGSLAWRMAKAHDGGDGSPVATAPPVSATGAGAAQPASQPGGQVTSRAGAGPAPAGAGVTRTPHDGAPVVAPGQAAPGQPPPGEAQAPTAAAADTRQGAQAEPHPAKAAEAERSEDEPPEPESFDVEWLRDNALTGVSLNLFPDHLTLAAGDDAVIKSFKYGSVKGAAYAENRPAPGKRSGLGVVRGGVGRLFGAGKHWLTLETAEGEIVLRVGRSYSDIVPLLEKLTGRKVTTAK